MGNYFDCCDRYLCELDTVALAGELVVTGDDIRAYVDSYTHNADVNPYGRNPLP